MAVQCTHCGEELLGAVNRCWRCGQAFVPQAGASLAPPVRKVAESSTLPPIVAELAIAAPAGSRETSAAPVETQIAGIDILGASPATTTAASPDATSSRRQGSPFAEGQVLLAPADANLAVTRANVASYVPPAAQAWQPSHPAAVGGAVASIVLGMIGLAAGWYTAWILILCVVGVGMGVWGIYSTQRALAMIGIGLCCLALLIGGFCAVVRWYTLVNGSNPFDEIEQPVDLLE